MSYDFGQVTDNFYFCLNKAFIMKKTSYLLPILIPTLLLLVFISCKKDKDKDDVEVEPKLIFEFKFDSTQTRLDNLGNISTIPSGHSAQHPKFNKISAHYIELTPNALTQVGQGDVLYHAPETTLGGDQAIDFNQSIVVGEGQLFLEVPFSQITPGTYNYLRVSLSYQNYDINYLYDTYDLTGTLASFIGYNTYVNSYTIKNQAVNLNQNKLQGYWGFETLSQVFQGQAPGTTVPNPIADTSPIPAGSCLVTGQFSAPFIVTGNETENKTIVISLSTNNSFEWKDFNGDGKFAPAAGDTVVDMGIRGLIPIVQ